MGQKASSTDIFKKLTWDDLEGWAGSTIVSRGQNYQRYRHVQELARTPDGALVAWVQGTERYATLVDFGKGELTSACTCPYGYTCKHAVAVVLEHLHRLKKNLEVPEVDERDSRLILLEKGLVEKEGWEEDEEDEVFESVPRRKPSDASAKSLSAFLEEQTKKQLIVILKDLAERFPDVQEVLRNRCALSGGNVKKMVASIRKEIHELSSKPGWRNEWNGEGYTPDYSRVKERMEALLAKGYADEAVALGKELFKAEKRQLEMSDDHGLTGMEISSCLEVVFRALPKSSIPPSEQMLWVVETSLEDGYDLYQGTESFWERKHKASDWNILAGKLMERLNHYPSRQGEDSYSHNYRRDRLSDWVIIALENAGRKEEIIPLCFREAEKTGSYPRLVDYLMKFKRFKEAEEWIQKGITATREKWPGVASKLRTFMREIHEKAGDRLKAAAFYAEDFIQNPTLKTFKELERAAKRAEVWPEVRAGAMQYLETGKLSPMSSCWPFPETGIRKMQERRTSRFPVNAALIDIAIAEKRSDDVLRWYDQQKPRRNYWEWSYFEDDKVAEAIAGHYPDHALDIWKKLAESQVTLAKPKAYEEAGLYLRKIHLILKKLGREKEWQVYLVHFRRTNERKTKFLEILSRLEGRPIAEG